MRKLKVKCAHCGTIFVPTNSRQTLCPDCEKVQRAARARKSAESGEVVQARLAPPPLILGPGADILRPVVNPQANSTAMTAVEVAPEAPVSSAVRTETDAPPLPQQADPPPTPPTRPTATRHGKKRAPDDLNQRAPGARVVLTPFVVTDALREQIEERYLALAHPVEFDGIRTQVANELGAPKSAVRTVVREVRARRGMPSWWELQGFAGSPDDLERIKAAYTPSLPVPPVGIHKEIAQALGLEPRLVYRGIRKIRALMSLPQFNAPEAHPELAPAVVASGDVTDAMETSSAALQDVHHLT
jgi:hypothetical protein